MTQSIKYLYHVHHDMSIIVLMYWLVLQTRWGK
jgi:hypothetical protein